MTDEERLQLAELLSATRVSKGLTAREVARRAGVDVGTVSLLERCKIAQPRVESVRAIAQVLGIPLADIYTMVHWLPRTELPSLKPYMRAKYGDLPDEAVEEVERFVTKLAEKHNRGPIDNEDER
jgi:transcriptional regulator with XRE-family HTH domain